MLGPRQAGKSTLVRQFADERSMPYVTLDDATTLQRAMLDPTGFVADNPAPIVIDEIQRAPGLMLELKRRVDAAPAPGQFLITGSANLVAMASIPDALPGRVDYLRLWPLLQAEIEETPPTFLERLFENRPARIDEASTGRRAYARRIVVGGYPDALWRSDEGRDRLLSGLVESTLGRDAGDVWNGDAAITRRVLQHVAARSGSTFNATALARDIGISAVTVRAHVGVLEALFLVRRHPAWFANIDRRLTKMPKLYVADSGLMCSLLGADDERLVRDDVLAGSAFETFVVNELVRMDAAGSNRHEFHHYRDAHGREIDLVVERPDGSVVAVEVKSAATVTERDFAHIRDLRSRIGSRFASGVVLHAGERTHSFAADLHAIPISAMWSRAGASG